MHWAEIIITVIGSVAASSGFWAWVQSRSNKKNTSTQMILGLGHDRIITLCEKYIDRGWISADEYDNLRNYLYEPYVKLGGNGTAKRLMEIVDKLPTKTFEYTAEGKRVEKDQKTK